MKRIIRSFAILFLLSIGSLGFEPYAQAAGVPKIRVPGHAGAAGAGPRRARATSGRHGRRKGGAGCRRHFCIGHGCASKGCSGKGCC